MRSKRKELLMHKVIKGFFLVILPMLLLNAHYSAKAEVLVTGEITSLEKQVVSAPRSDSWQTQIQWMYEEGAIAKQGDLIAVFDSGSIKAQIKQSEERLASEKLLLKKKEFDLQQGIVDAEGQLKVAILEVEKAHIEAEITSQDISKYDQGKNQLALERALLSKIKAEENLAVKKKEREVELEKQALTIIKIEESLAYQKQTLSRSSVVANITGQVSHMMHPWNGEKITPGTMLQQSMQAMLVQGQGAYRVQGWVHEIDVNKIAENDKVSIKLDAYPETTYLGKIESVASQSDKKETWSNSAYHRIFVSFDVQPERKLLPGMSVQVVVEGSVQISGQGSAQVNVQGSPQ